MDGPVAPPMRHSADDIVAAGRRLRDRRRAGWLTAAVAALITATIAVPGARQHEGSVPVAPGVSRAPAPVSGTGHA
ncbi:hypothetical protein [Jidongwangia harbinensis]|uniref:hypothetical protein n=1 Tax=Jidongwangia harbinensis TaxID=2878561 RepID=UPI001CD9C958|nr:hypothetical protein [Jidongwangia harbinensis]MCA2214634.1 hypothetical protein [Jidongwangia harbinensis]